MSTKAQLNSDNENLLIIPSLLNSCVNNKSNSIVLGLHYTNTTIQNWLTKKWITIDQISFWSFDNNFSCHISTYSLIGSHRYTVHIPLFIFYRNFVCTLMYISIKDNYTINPIVSFHISCVNFNNNCVLHILKQNNRVLRKFDSKEFLNNTG